MLRFLQLLLQLLGLLLACLALLEQTFDHLHACQLLAQVDLLGFELFVLLHPVLDILSQFCNSLIPLPKFVFELIYFLLLLQKLRDVLGPLIVLEYLGDAAIGHPHLMLRVSAESVVDGALLRTVHFLLQNLIVLLKFVVLLLQL